MGPRCPSRMFRLHKPNCVCLECFRQVEVFGGQQGHLAPSPGPHILPPSITLHCLIPTPLPTPAPSPSPPPALPPSPLGLHHVCANPCLWGVHGDLWASSPGGGADRVHPMVTGPCQGTAGTRRGVRSRRFLGAWRPRRLLIGAQAVSIPPGLWPLWGVLTLS